MTTTPDDDMIDITADEIRAAHTMIGLSIRQYDAMSVEVALTGALTGGDEQAYSVEMLKLLYEFGSRGRMVNFLMAGYIVAAERERKLRDRIRQLGQADNGDTTD